MGGTNSGRSHEPQQCGGAHLPNTLSSPNAAPAGIGDRQNTTIPDDPHPKSSDRTLHPRLPPQQNRRCTGAPKATPIASGVRGAEPPGAAGPPPYGGGPARGNAGASNSRRREPAAKAGLTQRKLETRLRGSGRAPGAVAGPGFCPARPRRGEGPGERSSPRRGGPAAKAAGPPRSVSALNLQTNPYRRVRALKNSAIAKIAGLNRRRKAIAACRASETR